jgi:hypothetical protein
MPGLRGLYRNCRRKEPDRIPKDGKIGRAAFKIIMDPPGENEYLFKKIYCDDTKPKVGACGFSDIERIPS